LQKAASIKALFCEGKANEAAQENSPMEVSYYLSYSYDMTTGHINEVLANYVPHGTLWKTPD